MNCVIERVFQKFFKKKKIMSSLLEEIVFGKKTFQSKEEDTEKEEKPKRTPAWIDPSDAAISIPAKKANILDNEEEKVSGEAFQEELSKRFERATEHIDTSWADLDKNTGQTYESTSIFTGQTDSIPTDRLVIIRRADLPKTKDAGGFKKIAFHPIESICAYIGNKGTLTVASYSNEATSALFELPANGRFRYCLCYSPDGARIFVGCSQGKFQSIDSNGSNLFDNMIPGCKDDVNAIDCSENLLALVTTKSVHFFNSSNLSFIRSVETSEDKLMCGKFTEDGEFFVVAGSHGRGHVISCDTKKIKSVAVFQHEEHQHIRALDCRGGLVAMGTEAGILSLFELDSLRISPKPGRLIIPKPILTKMNLTTYIDTVRFHPSGEILVFASSGTTDALKILNVPSGQVYPNWPTQKTPLKYVKDADFSGNGLYLAISNNKNATMWEIPFYKPDKDETEQ